MKLFDKIIFKNIDSGKKLEILILSLKIYNNKLINLNEI